MRPPDWSVTPARPHIEDLPIGASVARVFNADDAALHGYSPVGCNPNYHADVTVGIQEGGRFDGTASDPYSYLYVAHGGDLPVATALWEVVLHKATLSSSSGLPELAEGEVVALGVQYLIVSHPCPLLWVDDAARMLAVGAEPQLTTSEDYDTSRQWARYLRAKFPNIHGIAYRSRRRGGGGTNAVLFGDRCEPGARLRPSRPYRKSGPPITYRRSAHFIRGVAAAEGITIA